jgi:hypothetical protein
MDAVRRILLLAPINAVPPHHNATSRLMLAYLDWFPVLETVDVVVYTGGSAQGYYPSYFQDQDESAVIAQGEASLNARIQAVTSNEVEVVFHHREVGADGV